MNEYIIVGDTAKYKGVLVTCGFATRERAEGTLNRMLTNPTPNDKRLMEGHENLRIQEEPKEKCWWHDPFLCN